MMFLLYDLAMLLVSLGVILMAAGLFTNGVEWVGKIAGLTQSAVGSILAAVGTALPETVIPLIAILFGTGDLAHEIGIGAILGAPFMLSTLAFFLTGVAVFLYRKRRAGSYPMVRPSPEITRRDLGFFLVVYTLAIATAFFPAWLRPVSVVLLVAAYGYFVYKTLTCPGGKCAEMELEPLYFARKSPTPPAGLVYLQVALALGLIIAGAKFFVDGMSSLASEAGVSALVFSLLVAPVATELPEKFNTVIWIGQNKDSFALGNITGAMVFQSSIVPAVGIALTPWVLNEAALLSAVLALLSSLLVYQTVRSRGKIHIGIIMISGFFYAAFAYASITGLV